MLYKSHVRQAPQVVQAEYTRPVDKKKVAFLLSHIPAGASILELGCGQGLILDHLTAHERVGVELSPEEASVASSKGHDIRLGHAGRFSAQRTFDVVIASEVIEHMLDPQSLLENAARHLEPGGLLLLTTPNGFGYYEWTNRHLNLKGYLMRWNLLRGILGREPYKRGDSWDHCQWFTIRRLLKMTCTAGFELIAQSNSDFITGSERDLKIADRIPAWMASGWYFVFRRRG